MVTGYRREDQFVPKKYTDSAYRHTLQLIKEINDRDGAYSVSFSHSTVLAASLGNELLIVNFK